MKILVLTVNKNDSTSFYRANGVLGDLRRQMKLEITSMDFNDLNNMSWASLMLYDVVFMQRPYQAVALKMAQYCREMSLPVWVDFDDHLLEVPSDNRSYSLFSNPATKSNIVEIIRLSNVMTVSTGALKSTYEPLNENIRVVPNAFNDKLFRYRAKQPTKKTMLWRGSETHNMDMFYYGDPMYESQVKYTDWEFLYFGFNPWFIPETPNKKYLSATDPILYFRQIYGLAPRAMQVPLIKSLFNLCKSNIAWIEGTFAGAVCLVPDWPEWNLPGTITYNSAEDYREKLRVMLNESVNFKKKNAQSWEYIMENLTLEKVNKQRMEILESLI